MRKEVNEVMVPFAFGVGVGFWGMIALLIVAHNGYDKTFTLGNLIQSGATLSAGLVVAAYVQKKAQVNLKQKELIVAQIGMLSERLLELGGMNLLTGENLSSVTALLKRISMTHKILDEVLGKVGIFKRKKLLEGFSGKILELRKLATSTPIQGMSGNLATDGAAVSDGVLALQSERQSLLQLQIEQMRNQLFESQFTVLTA